MTGKAIALEETEASIYWDSILQRVFQDRKNIYVCVAKQQMVGIYHSIFIKERHWSHVRDYRKHSEKVRRSFFLSKYK